MRRSAGADRLVDQYLALSTSLGGDAGTMRPAVAPDGPLPTFEGFQTIERLGGGGMGEVYKLKDLTLDRIVAGKIVRPDRPFDSARGGAAGVAQDRPRPPA